MNSNLLFIVMVDGKISFKKIFNLDLILFFKLNMYNIGGKKLL